MINIYIIDKQAILNLLTTKLYVDPWQIGDYLNLFSLW